MLPGPPVPRSSPLIPLDGSRPVQTIGNRLPFTGFGQSFDNDQFRPRLVALMQFPVESPRKGLRIVWNH